MEKIYEANGKEKKEIINADNDYRAHLRNTYYRDEIGIKDIIMVGRTKNVPKNLYLDIRWSLNGLREDEESLNEGDIIVIEPLEKQIESNILNINESDTRFEKPIKLSKRAIILLSVDKYNEIIKEPNMKRILKKMNVRLYEGEEELATQMVFFDKKYIYLEVGKAGYVLDNIEHIDALGYTKTLKEKQIELAELLQKNELDKNSKIKASDEKEEDKEGIGEIEISSIEINHRIITGLTKEVEGEIKLDDELYGATDIGKTRDNQEDAILLIKDKDNPKFKMMVVADGMGGLEYRRNCK